jgi:arsenite methyltransferase
MYAHIHTHVHDVNINNNNKLRACPQTLSLSPYTGELFFSDVYADRRIPEALRADKVLWGECLSGALYTEDFRRCMARVGFVDVREVSSTRMLVNSESEEIRQRTSGIVFYSKLVRAFKLPELEDRCEDYGQSATYLGGIEECPHAFFLDDHHCFVTDHPMRVCGNTADMLCETRYAKHFRVSERGPHRGLFDCIGGSAGGDAVCVSGSCC